MRFFGVISTILALFILPSRAQLTKTCFLNNKPVSCSDPTYLAVTGGQSGGGGVGGGRTCLLNGVTVPCDDPNYLQASGGGVQSPQVYFAIRDITQQPHQIYGGGNQQCFLNGSPVSCTDRRYLQTVTGAKPTGGNQCFLNGGPISCNDPLYLSTLGGGQQNVVSVGGNQCFLNGSPVSCTDPRYVAATGGTPGSQQPTSHLCFLNNSPVSCTDKLYLQSVKKNNGQTQTQCFLDGNPIACNDQRYLNALIGQPPISGITETSTTPDCTYDPTNPLCEQPIYNTAPAWRPPTTAPSATRRITKPAATRRTTAPPTMPYYEYTEATTRKQMGKTCGKQLEANNRIKPLIHNGEKVALGEYPWITAIYERPVGNTLICGGSIITPYTILSAAHCFFDETLNTKKEAANYFIAVGKVKRPYNVTDSSVTKIYDIDRIVMENFFGTQLRFLSDIAILETKTEIQFNYRVIPVCIRFTESSIPPSTQLQVAGWGTDETGQPSETLKTAKFIYLSSADCVYRMDPDTRDYISGDKFCVYHANGTALDVGDSGSGLTLRDEDSQLHYIVGLVSFKASTPEAKVSVITDVNKYSTFIKKTVKDIHRGKKYDVNYLT